MDYAEVVDYPYFVDALFCRRAVGVEGMVHAAIGVSGEAGEILDAIKKTWVYGQPLDRENLIEELGDIEFYLQALRSLLNVPRGEVLQANMTKLRKRYPTGYSDKAAQARADKQA